MKLQNPKILIRNNEIDLSKLDLFLSLKSFFSSDFLLKRAEVAFIKNDIKDLTKISNIFLPRFINKRLDKIFAKGNLEGEFVIPFQPDGSIGSDYGFSGKVSNALINLTKEFSIKNLTTEINHVKNIDSNGFKVTIQKGSIYDLELANSIINLKREKNETKVQSFLRTNGKLNFSQIRKISSLFGLNINNFKGINGTADLKTNINFNLDKKLLNFSKTGDGFDSSEVKLKLKNKAIVNIFSSYYAPLFKYWLLVFENGIIKIENDNIEIRGPRNTFDKKGNFEVPKSIKSIKFSAKKDFDDSLVKSVIYFLNKYKNNKTIPRHHYWSSLKSNFLVLK